MNSAIAVVPPRPGNGAEDEPHHHTEREHADALHGEDQVEPLDEAVEHRLSPTKRGAATPHPLIAPCCRRRRLLLEHRS